MRFKGLDLNLLHTLNTLLEEQSVSRAAERLNLSQPAVSASLARLRDYFSDPLLQSHGKRMIPTAHALRIQEQLKHVLTDIDLLIAQSSLFDPKTSTRRFQIIMSDYVAKVYAAPLMEQLLTEAPNISIQMVMPDSSSLTMMEQGKIDLLITPEEICTNEHPREFFFEEQFVVVGCRSNPVFERGLTEEEFLNADHVAAKFGRMRPVSIAEDYLARHGRPRRNTIEVESFLLAPEFVLNSSRLTVMHKRLVQMISKRLPIAWCEMPFEFPVLREFFHYHETRRDEPGLRWMIDRLKALSPPDLPRP